MKAIKLPTELHQRIKDLAHANYRSMSSQVEMLLDHYTNNPRGEVLPTQKSSPRPAKSPSTALSLKESEPGIVMVQFTNINKKKVTQEVHFKSAKHLEELLVLNKKLKPSVVSASFANQEDMTAWATLNYETLPITPDDSLSWRDK